MKAAQPKDLRSPIQQANPATTLIRIPEVMALTGLARGTIYKRLKDDEDFPRPVPLTNSKTRGAPVGWVLGEVQAWVCSQIAKRDQGAQA
ncbi:MAG: AlpA family phage regulatory protein [Pseudomonas sp.]|jgi:prophage regulatory protein|uniref:helix-turn-helix transcriptional regulator n=1 Tax=Ectopseudomonas mendocina TaxID=300 RepID=UPI002ABBE255|nr:AlpA family phage regulatory protein [Pseudomonas sp.]MDZ4192613.1 AlpA family phage regulatory protein [Pseudomonas sp.]